MCRLLHPCSEEVIVLDTSIWDLFSTWKTCVAETGQGARPFKDDDATGESQRTILEGKLRKMPIMYSKGWVIVPIVDG